MIREYILINLILKEKISLMRDFFLIMSTKFSDRIGVPSIDMAV